MNNRVRSARLHHTLSHPLGVVTSVVLTVILAGLWSKPASAQGTSNTLPDPITTGELMRYAQRLSLSDHQHRAAEAFHDQYMRDFRFLRNGEIAEFLKSMRGLQGAGVVPNRAVVEEFLQDMAKMRHKIETLDERLFDQMQPSLAEQQLVLMPSVRDARARKRFGVSQMMWMGGAPPDISDLLLDLNLEESERQATASILRPYEKKLTKLMERSYEANTTMMLDMITAIEEAGFAETSMTDPETAIKMQEMIQQVMKDIAAKSRKVTNKMNDLNQSTYERLRDLLAPTNNRLFQQAYVGRGYKEIAEAIRWNRRPYTRAAEHRSLTDSQRREVERLLVELDTKMMKLGDTAIQELNDFRRDNSMMDMNSDYWTKRSETINKIREDGERARAEAKSSLASVVGDTLAGRLQSEEADPAAKAQGNVLSQLGLEPEEAVNKEPEEIHYHDQYLPMPIQLHHIRMYAETLGLDEDQTTVLTALHEEYLHGLSQIEPIMQAASKVQKNMWSHNANTDTVEVAEDLSIVDELFAERQTGLTTMLEYDKRFFDEVQQVMLSEEDRPAMQRVRNMRLREVYQRGRTDGGFSVGGDQEATVDLIKLIREQRWQKSLRDPLEQTLADYEAKLVDIYRQRYALALDNQRVTDRLQLEVHKLQQEGKFNGVEYSEMYREAMGDLPKRLQKANQDVVELNQRTLQSLVDQLPAADGSRLRKSYQKRSFPNIYNDETAAGDYLRRAMELTDLSPEQRSRLGDLVVDYRSNYNKLCENMVTNSRGALNPMMMGNDPKAWAEFQQRQEKVSLVRFERTELNGRAIRKLQETLTEEQLTLLGQLPDITQDQSSNWWEQ